MIKRPALALFAAVLSGVLLHRYGTWAALSVLGLYALLVFLFFYFSERFKEKIRKVILPSWYGNLILLLVLIPGVFATSFWGSSFREMKAYEGRAAYTALYDAGCKKCVLRGTVTDKWVDDGGPVLKLQKCTLKDFYENIERSGGGCEIYLQDKYGNLPACGDIVTVSGKFYYIDGPQNPGEYDALPNCLKEDVHARVIAENVGISECGNKVLFRFKDNMCDIRMRFSQVLLEIFGAADGGILVAMLTGNKDFETEEIRELYKRAGIGHILAISGLHISLICLGLWRFLKKHVCGRNWATVIASVFLLIFIVFTGASVSSLRAGCMCLVYLLGKIMRRHYDLLSSLAATGSLILFFMPWELYAPSFLLSFTAVIAVHFARELNASFSFGLIITIFTMPVTAMFFYEIPTYSFIANLLIVPLTGVLLLLGMLSGTAGMFWLPAGKFAGGGAFLLLKFFEAVSNFTSHLPFSTLLVGRPGAVTVILYYLLLAVVYKGIQRSLEKRLSETKTEEVPASIERGGRATNERGKRVRIARQDLLIGIDMKHLINGDETDLRERAGKCLRGKSGKLLAARRVKQLITEGEKHSNTGNNNRSAQPEGYGKYICFACVIVGLILLVYIFPTKPSLTFLSVGQGDCSVFLPSGTAAILFDCGSTSRDKVGEYVLAPFLKSEGVMLIDKATVSHTDRDHISGIIELLENMNEYRSDFDYMLRYDGNIGIRTLVLPKVRETNDAYDRLVTLAESKNVRVEYIEAGDEIKVGANMGVGIEVGARIEAGVEKEVPFSRWSLICLSPRDAATSDNETSLAFRLDMPSFTAFMMGDAGKETEAELLQGENPILERFADESSDTSECSVTARLKEFFGRDTGQHKTTILKVGHHGSRTATSEEFIDAIRPDMAVISCGRGNTYGHPHWQVLAILEDAGVAVHRTDREGAVVIGR